MNPVRAFLEELKLEIIDFWRGLEALPAVIFVVAGLVMWAFHYYGGNEFFDESIGPRLAKATSFSPATIGLLRCCYWSWTALVLFVLVPQAALSVTTLLTKQPVERGFALGDRKAGLVAFALFYGAMIPLLFLVAGTPDFRAHYPSCAHARDSWTFFMIYEVHYVLFFCWWESFFRGFLTLGLEKKFGFWTIFVQMLPFVVMHFDKPNLEALSSVFAGILLGYLALRTRSFWYGAAIHAATAFTLDVIAMATHHPVANPATSPFLKIQGH